MFWLLIFLIALGALAYFGARIRTSMWVMAALVVAYGLFGSALILFFALVVVWLVVFIPLAITILRHEWLSRPLLERLRHTIKNLPEDTLTALDSDNTGADAPLLSGSANWPSLRAIKPSPVDASLQSWLDKELDNICSSLIQTPGNDAARNQFCAAALGLLPRAEAATAEDSEDEQPELPSAADLAPASTEDRAEEPEPATTRAPRAALRAAVCAHAAAAVGPAAWPPCSPLRAGWLNMLQTAAKRGHARDWLPSAEQQLDALAVASTGLDPTLQTGGWATITASGSGADTHAELLIRLRSDLRADHSASRYALLLDFAGRAEQRGSTCVVLDANTPGLAVKPTVDGRILLSGTAVRAPLSALAEGVRGIGCGQRRLTAAIATAQAIHAPALRFGQMLPLALACGWRARLHLPGEAPATQLGAVRNALAAGAAELYAANALGELTLAQLSTTSCPIGLAAAADLRLAAIAERIAERARGMARGGALEQLALSRTRPTSVRTQTHVGLRALGRCHPFFGAQWRAARNPQEAQALEDFDLAYWSHLKHLLSNLMHALVVAVGGARPRRTRELDPTVARCLRRTNRSCISLSLTIDLLLFSKTMALLKDAELLSAVGNAVSRLQLARAVIWKAQRDNAHPATAALQRIAIAQALDATQEDIHTLTRALPAVLRGLARTLTAPFGRWDAPRGPHDAEIATTWLCDGDAAHYFRKLLPSALPAAALTLRQAAEACRSGEPLLARLSGDTRSPVGWGADAIQAARAAGRLDADAAERLCRWISLCDSAGAQGVLDPRPATPSVSTPAPAPTPASVRPDTDSSKAAND